MATERGVSIPQQQVGMMLSPEEELALASRAAKALQGVVSKKLKPVIMNGEQYLEFDDWQLLGQFYHYTVKTGDAVPVEVDGVKGAKAHADLIDMNTGEYLGGAEAYCMRDEEHWNTRPEYEYPEGVKTKVGDKAVPWFQLASMAQTRAGAKAFRNRLAWVVVLAGYKATPAEEMGSIIESEAKTVNKTKHWCAEHNTAFFMRGKMRSYAHPTTGKDANGKDIWCYEPAEKPASTPSTTTKQDTQAVAGSQAPPTEDKAVTAEKQGGTEASGSPIDLTWLTESLKTINWKEATVLSWLKSKANFQGLDFTGKLSDVIARMSKEQVAFLTAEIEERLQMA